MRIPLLILLATSTLNAAEADIRGYLDTHCFDCHDSTTKKGGLDLESLPMQFDQVERFSAWAHVHDRIAAGEDLWEPLVTKASRRTVDLALAAGLMRDPLIAG